MNKNLILTAVGCLVAGSALGYGLGMYQNQENIKFDTQSVRGGIQGMTKESDLPTQTDKKLYGRTEIDKLQATRLQEQEEQAQAEFQQSEAQEARRLASDKRLSDTSRQPFGDGKVIDQKSALSACSSIADIPEDECIALITLYWSTNGPKRTTGANWLQNNSACTWYGVSCYNGHVKRLYPSSNQLSGPIPAEIGKLSELEELNLNRNNLSGPIPTEIGRLSELTILDFSDNKLSGPIPAEIGKLSELEELNLNRNNLSGPIPTEIGRLNNLGILKLRSNNLSGPIPAEIGRLSNLTRLNFANNKLSGPIPTEIWRLSKLVMLDFNNNRLSGPISTEIGKLSNLWYLSLGQDNLSGPIPAEIGKLSKLKYLYLHDSQLCGYIPESFVTAWLETPDIDIQNNKLMKDGYSPMMTNWLVANINFGTQDSTECKKGPVTPDTPKEGDNGMY